MAKIPTYIEYSKEEALDENFGRDIKKFIKKNSTQIDDDIFNYMNWTQGEKMKREYDRVKNTKRSWKFVIIDELQNLNVFLRKYNLSLGDMKSSKFNYPSVGEFLFEFKLIGNVNDSIDDVRDIAIDWESESDKSRISIGDKRIDVMIKP